MEARKREGRFDVESVDVDCVDAREEEEGDSIRDTNVRPSRSMIKNGACVISQRETLALLLGAGGVGC